MRRRRSGEGFPSLLRRRLGKGGISADYVPPMPVSYTHLDVYKRQAHYSAMLDEDGTFVDDVVVHKLSDNDYLIVINAGTREKDVAWVRRQVGAMPGIHINDYSDSVSYTHLALLVLVDEVVGHELEASEQFGQDVVAEVVGGVGVFGVLHQLGQKDVCVEEVDAHGGVDHLRVEGRAQVGGLGLFDEAGDLARARDFDHAEAVDLIAKQRVQGPLRPVDNDAVIDLFCACLLYTSRCV